MRKSYWKSSAFIAAMLNVFLISGVQADDSNMVTIENFKHENDATLEVAQLMCFKRHLAPYREKGRQIEPGKHKLWVRAVNLAWANRTSELDPVVNRRPIAGAYALIEADLKPGQHVAIYRLFKDKIAYVWLHDLDTGQPASKIIPAKLTSPFAFSSQRYDRQCAKGTV
ncbi:hypothetical protein [Neptunicella marina]|uniref:SH3 domain-containing protein n=1 Tax=Neptunicella marina TaxID=2125989 RepID=A0A8J6IRN2_9ALTE|nr:hypothetical protein [Neptunicella marina]MBC3764535.1 hypothetical protein [Neptunicella marina]